jgi:CENP-B N-terminal DNA-binding domain
VRELMIRARTGEGRARAVANCVRIGRPPKLTEHQKNEAIKLRDRGEDSLADIGRSYNVSGWTIARLCPCQRHGNTGRLGAVVDGILRLAPWRKWHNISPSYEPSSKRAYGFSAEAPNKSLILTQVM